MLFFIRYNKAYNIKKCGTNLCIIQSLENIRLFNYKNYKSIKEIISSAEIPIQWVFIINNENLILLFNIITYKIKIYDTIQDKIIKNYISNDNIHLSNNLKVGNNLFIAYQNKSIFQWKYNFTSNDIEIIKKINCDYLNNSYLKLKIIDDKLFIIKKKYINESKNKILYLFIYK